MASDATTDATTVRQHPALPAPPPVINPDNAAYWAAARRGELLLSVCPDCERVIWYPKSLCAACGGTLTEWRAACGRGAVWSYTVVRRGTGSYAEAGPYVVALVELEEGPRIMTNIVDIDAEAVHIGQAVEVVFDVASEDAALPRFRPVA